MIEFKPFERSHYPQLINWVQSPDFLLQWAGSSLHYPLTNEQLDNYQQDPAILAYSVYQKGTSKVIGHISLARIDQTNKSARVGRVLVGDPNVRGKGIGELMVNETLRIAFDELKLHRVSLGVFDFNLDAIACYEKVGFKKEGLLRDTCKFEGEYWSLWEMSILEHEWCKIRSDVKE